MKIEEIKVPRHKITPEMFEKDLYIQCMLICFSSAEIFLREAEKHIKKQLAETNDVKKFAKANPALKDELLKHATYAVLRHNDKYGIGETLKNVEAIKTSMEKITDFAQNVNCVNKMEFSDEFRYDSNFLCRVLMLMWDAREDPSFDEKIENSLKNRGKKRRVNQTMLDKFIMR